MPYSTAFTIDGVASGERQQWTCYLMIQVPIASNKETCAKRNKSKRTIGRSPFATDTVLFVGRGEEAMRDKTRLSKNQP